MLKVQADIKFIKTCKSERLIRTFANFKLAIKNAKHKLKSKIARLILETELQSKHNQKKKIMNYVVLTSHLNHRLVLYFTTALFIKLILLLKVN